MGNAATNCSYISPYIVLCQKREVIINNSEWNEPMPYNHSQGIAKSIEINESKNTNTNAKQNGSIEKNSLEGVDKN